MRKLKSLHLTTDNSLSSPRSTNLKQRQQQPKREDSPIEPEMQAKINQLKQVTRDVEHRIPLLHYKTNDEINQIKNFLLVYYRPILSKIDIEQIKVEGDIDEENDNIDP